MNKLNPVDVADRFESDITKLVDYYNRSVEALAGTPIEKSDRSLLAEHVFLSAAISFEGALSDLFFAYANIDSSAFIAKKEGSIKDQVRREFGQWYADKIAFGTVKHLKASELYPLLDPHGHNITFYDAKKMVDRATKQGRLKLHVQHLADSDIGCCDENVQRTDSGRASGDSAALGGG